MAAACSVRAASGSQSPNPASVATSLARARAYATARVARTTRAAEMRMYFLRRKRLWEFWSESAPTRGWTTSPESGPAIQTSEVACFERPRARRYGVPYAISTVHASWAPNMPTVRELREGVCGVSVAVCATVAGEDGAGEAAAGGGAAAAPRGAAPPGAPFRGRTRSPKDWYVCPDMARAMA